MSSLRQLIIGVVQGVYVLGPLLLLRYVDDVVKLFSSRVGLLCKLYADDLKLHSIIQTRQDASKLQSSLDALVAWSDQWQLNVSAKKISSVMPWSNQCYVIKQANLSIPKYEIWAL